MPCRGELDDDRQGGGGCRREAKPDQDAQQRQQPPGAGRKKTDEPGADRTNKGAGHDLQLASPNIGETPPHQRAEDRADPAAVKD